jgi:hypothetical protein
VAGTAGFGAHVDPGVATKPGFWNTVVTADDPATNDPADLEILDSIVTPYTFSPRNGNRWVLRGGGESSGIEAEKVKRFFFEVPQGAGALQLAAISSAAERSGLVMYVTDPLGQPAALETGAFVPGGRGATTIPAPAPGTWEVDLHARERGLPGTDERPRDREVVPFHAWQLEARLLAATLTPSSWTAKGAPGGRVTQEFTAINEGAEFTGRATGSDLVRSARATREISTKGGQSRFGYEVPAGTTELTVSIGNPGDLGSDLDLYLYDPTGNLAAYSAGGSAEETVTIADPAAGTWAVVVDPYSIPSGSTTYDSRADLATPGLGRISTDDDLSEHPRGSRWTFTAFASVPGGTLPAGWVYAGQVLVTDTSGARIGAAEVTLTPEGSQRSTGSSRPAVTITT